MGAWWVSAGSPSDVRSFDPLHIADLEYRMWVGYYPAPLDPGAGCFGQAVAAGLRQDWVRTLQGVWLMLRAVQLWLRSPTTTLTVPGPACASLPGLVAFASASPRIRHERPPLRSTGGGHTGSVSMRPILRKPATNWSSR